MRGPDEGENSNDQNLTTVGGSTKRANERDTSSSPPSKRLKQAVLNFQSNMSTKDDSSLPSTSSPSPCSNGVAKDIVVIDDDPDASSSYGGLVTAASTPPKNTESLSASSGSSSVSDSNEIQEIPSNDPTPTTPSKQSSQTDDQTLTTTPIQEASDKNKTPGKDLSSAEKKKRKEETQRIKEEKQKQKEEKKTAREKERLEVKQKKEQERLEKQAEREKKEKERQEKKQKEEKERQEKKEKRDEEKRKKEEELNAKLEEKKKKEEEKRMQEETEKKKIKTINSFAGFFTKLTPSSPKTSSKAEQRFKLFEIKPFMSIAPAYRTQLTKDSLQNFDKAMETQTGSYLQDLQKRKPLPRYKRQRRRNAVVKPVVQVEPMEITDDKPAVIELMDDDSNQSSVVEIQQEEKKRMKAIFLKFHENNRPPYYGTHEKKSKKISGKKPFEKDDVLLNYEVDSDDEWEEEEPGESLSDSEQEGDNEEENDDDDEDDGFMVPHGYLSDDEGLEKEEGNLAVKKEQQLAKVKAWEAELNKKCKPMKPVCLGCLWPEENNVNEVLKRFEACLLVDGPEIPVYASSSAITDSCVKTMGETSIATPDTGYNAAMYVPEEAMPDLIKMVHGSAAGVVKLINHFRRIWSAKCEAHPPLKGKAHISKRQLEKKIQAISTKERRKDKLRWYVHQSILANYSLEHLIPAESLPEIQNSIGRPTSSPPVLATGIKQFSRPVSPCVPVLSKPEASTLTTGIKQFTVPVASKPEGPRRATLISSVLITNTIPENQKPGNPIVQTIQVNNTCKAASTVKRRVVLQTISTQAVNSCMNENQTKDKVALEQTKAVNKPSLSSEGTECSKIKAGLIETSTLGLPILHKNSTCTVPEEPQDLTVTTSNPQYLTSAVKRQASSPDVLHSRAAKVRRTSEELAERIPMPMDIVNITTPVKSAPKPTKENTAITQESVKQVHSSKEGLLINSELSAINHIAQIKCCDSSMVESIIPEPVDSCSNDSVNLMEVEQTAT